MLLQFWEPSARASRAKTSPMRSALLASFALPAALVVMSTLAACGGDAPPPATPASPAASAAPADSSAAPASSASSAAVAPTTLPTTWSDTMPKEQQMAFMKQNVQPAMAKVFQAHDATKYADFGCKTCHGPEYKNPHAFLPHLAMKDGKMTAFADKPAVSKFMAENVVPQMATAMGEKPYDMATHQGFGCGGCHTIDMK